MVERYYIRDGVFSIEGMELSTILRERRTPFYLYSAELVRQKYRKLKAHFPAFDIFYSLKSNPNLVICQTLLSLGANADVSSLGELRTALAAGFRPENIAFVGPGKRAEELRAAVESGIYALIVESPEELRLVEDIGREQRRSIRVLLRVNTCTMPKGSAEIMTGGAGKFGFDEERVVEQVCSLPLTHADLAGIHIYSASQVLEAGYICEHIANTLSIAQRLSKELGFPLKCIDFGGGFGIPYRGEPELDLGWISRYTSQLLQEHQASLRGVRLMFEVGRYLIGEAGVFVTQVVRVKESRGKRFIITDGGMNQFTRMAFLRINHPVRILNKVSLASRGEFQVCGPCCTPLDVVGRDVALPEPEPGDVIGVFNAGAYGYTMSMINFLSFGWPEEIMVDAGEMRVIRRGRKEEELLAEQLDT